MRWLDSITDSVDMNLSTLWDSGGAWCAQSRRSQKSWTQLSDRTTVTTRCLKADSPVLFRPTLVGTARQDADQKLHYVLISKRKTKTNQETHKTQKYIIKQYVLCEYNFKYNVYRTRIQFFKYHV